MAEISNTSRRIADGSSQSSSSASSSLTSGSSASRITSSELEPQSSSRKCVTLYPQGDFRNLGREFINDLKCDVMLNRLRAAQEERIWRAGERDEEGVVIKKSRGKYSCEPLELATEEGGLFETVQRLNVKVAMTVCTSVIRILLRQNRSPFIKIKSGLHLQVLPSFDYLPRCQKHQYAAFIADRGLLIVWDDDPNRILERAEELEKTLVKMVWRNHSAYPEANEKVDDVQIEEVEVTSDVESGHASTKPRPIMMLQAIYTALAITTSMTIIALGWRQVAIEIAMDHQYLRVCFVLAILPVFWLSLFFFQCLVIDFAQIFGPVNQVAQNSKFYSVKPPNRLKRARGTLPYITIQCPVYKEGLNSVIKPTILSIKAAISTYELQGGTANIFINDDGMQLIHIEDARARRDFYEEHNIGWVARPKHNPNPLGEGEKAFVRRGKFKKASNMNYALWVSARVEDRMAETDRSESWTQSDEDEAYHNALTDIVTEDEGRTWAEGNIRVGDYILLIDSDTRVPEDCFLDAVSEMEDQQSANLAIIQFSSGVMNVTDSFFERGITFFTNLIYTQIRFAVASGDVAPFVGHNALLRWSAVQDVAYNCQLDDSREKYWSESTVSEDFDMALRLQTAGYIIRLGAYTGDGFKEGVSLSVYDELARWEKYAYGCGELVFYPVSQWWRKGLVTPLFRRFLFSKAMPLPSKFTICAYIGTYYAIGCSLPLTVLNYFLIGWFNGALDHYYLESWRMLVGIIAIFSIMGNLALAVLRYRSGEKNILSSLLENLSWLPLLFLFLGGLSLHLSKALLCHLLGINISWGATNKEKEDISFFQEVSRVTKTFKWTFVMCFFLSVMMVVLAHFVSYTWRITLLTAIAPLGLIVFGHFALPTVLNPSLMRFTW